MAGRKSTILYSVMIALSSLVVGMVIASRLGLAPLSMAGSLDIPKTNSAPLVGPIDASTFRTIAQEASPTVVMCFIVVHVHAIAVNFLTQAVAGAVDELLAEAGFCNDVAAGAIDFPAVDGAARGDPGLNGLDRRVPAGHDGRERAGDFIRRLARESGPRDVGVDGARLVQLPPQVKEQQLVRADGPR